MKVMIVKPNQMPKVTDIENDLVTFQGIVDGFIEPVPIGNELVALVNEEGAIMGMTPNFSIGYTTLVGPVIIVRDTGKEEYESLKDNQINEVLQIVSEGRY